MTTPSRSTSPSGRSRLRARLAARGDEGIAMIMVIGSISVLTLLMAAALGYAMSTKSQARTDQDWHAALAAAQAGVDDYVARLNGNDNYWAEVDCTNDAMKGPNAGPNECGWNSSTEPGWQVVAAGNPESASFHYEVDSTRKDEEGGVRLTATGRSRDATRTLEVKVGRGGTTQFLYYTDFESMDPANPYSNSDHAYCGKQGTNLARYWWDGRSTIANSNTNKCMEIQFVRGDVLDGQAHFNDSPWIPDGAKFNKGFQTADPRCIGATNPDRCTRGGTGDVDVGDGYRASYHGPLYLEDNSDQFATFPGCQYTGDTRIKFNSNGTMRVWSKGSVGTDVGPGCGTADNTGLGSTAGQQVNQPYNEVIYVRNGNQTRKCATGEIVNVSGDRIPLAGDINMEDSAFYCGQGNVYVEGTVASRITIAAQNNVIVTDDLLLAGVAAKGTPTGPHMTGLVASNSVVIYHPVEEYCTRTQNGRCTATAIRNLTSNGDIHIHASIQTLQHSFWVQSFQHGAHRGDLIVRGSMAQRWRGAVGLSGSNGPGYIKDYRYDPRLKFNSPPYFPQYVNASWAATVTGEMPPAY